MKLPLGWRLIEKAETQSTNEDVKALPYPSDKTAVRADVQTGGHGRMGRHWVSPKGNLYISFCLENIKLAAAGMYSFLSAVALAQAMESLCAGLTVKCKWPNDLLIDGRKVSGILLETDGAQRLIVGIGVNLAERPAEKMLYPVTSLQEQGFDMTPEQMAEALLERFDNWKKILETQGCTPLLQAWKERAYGIGEPAVVNLPDRQIKGTFYGLDNDGCLLLNKDNELIRITAGDVFFGQTGKNENG